jgi:hypothetical protein
MFLRNVEKLVPQYKASQYTADYSLVSDMLLGVLINVNG